VPEAVAGLEEMSRAVKGVTLSAGSTGTFFEEMSQVIHFFKADHGLAAKPMATKLHRAIEPKIELERKSDAPKSRTGDQR
jgi:hypothetical protein